MLLCLLCGWSPEAQAKLTVLASPEVVPLDRWRYQIVLATNPTAAPQRLVVTLRRASGGVERHERSVEPLGSVRHEEYHYAGHPDPVVSLEAAMAEERAAWGLPKAIPPGQAALVVHDRGRGARRVHAALGRADIEVVATPPPGVPSRWMGLRGLAALALSGRTLSALAPAARRALLAYALHGGLVLVGAPLAAPPPGWPSLETPLRFGRGRLQRWDPTQPGPPPELAPWPAAPPGSAALPLPRSDRWPPVGWLVGGFATWTLAVAVGFSLCRRRPLAGVAVLGLALVAGLLPLRPAGTLSVESSVVWTEERAQVGRPRRAEARLVPEVGGVLVAEVPTDDSTCVTGLDRLTRLRLRWSSADGGWLVTGRWGEPVDLLIEDVVWGDGSER